MISMLIITFYLADGCVGETIKLPFSNIELTDPFAACVIFWCVFVWLNFRYWLVFRNAPFDSESQSTQQNDRNWISAWSAVIAWTPISHEDALKAVSDIVEFQNYKNQVTKEIYVKDQNYILLYKNDDQWAFWVSDAKGSFSYRSETLPSLLLRRVYLKNVVRALLNHPYITAWYSPWLLSSLALFIAIWH